jgi:hypothetical protein
MNLEKLCLAGLIAGAIGVIFSLFEYSQGGPTAGAAGLLASAFVIGSSLIALAIGQSRQK